MHITLCSMNEGIMGKPFKEERKSVKVSLYLKNEKSSLLLICIFMKLKILLLFMYIIL